MEKIAIAIDGPAGAGKSTIAKAVASKLGIAYIDTGAMYRAVALNILRNKLQISDIDKICELTRNTDIAIKGGRVFLNGGDVSREIRDNEVGKLSSPVSAIPYVREKLVELQRKMAQSESVIMDGRDIGTNVLKDADVKIFLTASIDERSMRRYLEFKSRGCSVDLKSVKSDITKRDELDTTRKLNPLKPADDAVIIDTTSKSIKEVIEEVLSIIKARCNDAL
ncbi:MAG TPA: (d)CMP kinase [Clostridiaceae bacterium]|nr:(d)CMP kinase [Clostridiaceae bacterium]